MAWIIVIVVMTVLQLPALPLQVLGHFLVDVLEHRGGVVDVARGERAVAFGLLLRRGHFVLQLLRRAVVLPVDHAPMATRCFFSRSTGSPSGKRAQSSAGRYFEGSSEVEWAPAR